MARRIDSVRDGIETELDALWRFAWQLTGDADAAAELVRRTCVHALERRAGYATHGKLRSWLFRAEHRIWFDELRARAVPRHRTAELPEAREAIDGLPARGATGAVPTADGEARVARPESAPTMDEIRMAVEVLPESQRLAMLLVCVQGCSYREAAEILEVPVGTVVSRLSRARIAVGARFVDGAPASRRATIDYKMIGP